MIILCDDLNIANAVLQIVESNWKNKIASESVNNWTSYTSIESIQESEKKYISSHLCYIDDEIRNLSGVAIYDSLPEE